jgi:hypothetical protein
MRRIEKLIPFPAMIVNRKPVARLSWPKRSSARAKVQDRPTPIASPWKDRPQAQVVKEDHPEDQHRADQPHLGQVPADQPVLGEADEQVPTETPARGGVEGTGVHPVQDRRHPRGRLLGLLEVGAHHPAADGDDHRLPVGALVVAAAREAPLVLHLHPQAGAHRLGIDRRRRALVQAELQPALLADLVGVPGLDLVEDLFQRAGVGVEAGARLQERKCILHSILHPSHPGRPDGRQGGDQRIAGTPQPRRVLTLQHHEDRGQARSPGGHPVKLDDARP